MTLTTRDRVLLAVIVAVVVVFGFAHFVLSPQHHRAASLETQVTAAQAALGKARQQYATGHAAAASLHGNAPAWAAAQRAVPQASDIPDLLRLLERSAQEAHVSMQSITFAGGSASAGDTGATGAVGSTSSDGATEVPVTLAFQGGYQALNRLLARLDDLVVVSGDSLRASGPLIGISNVSLATGGSPLAVNLTAVIYQHAAASTVTGPDTGATQ